MSSFFFNNLFKGCVSKYITFRDWALVPWWGDSSLTVIPWPSLKIWNDFFWTWWQGFCNPDVLETEVGRLQVQGLLILRNEFKANLFFSVTDTGVCSFLPKLRFLLPISVFLPFLTSISFLCCLSGLSIPTSFTLILRESWTPPSWHNQHLGPENSPLWSLSCSWQHVRQHAWPHLLGA